MALGGRVTINGQQRTSAAAAHPSSAWNDSSMSDEDLLCCQTPMVCGGVLSATGALMTLGTLNLHS
jgi:hypothetical protein